MMKNTKYQSRFQGNTSGFTLVELMITVVIVGILAAIAIPSYSQHVIKSNRAAAAGYIVSLTSKQQQVFLDTRQYFCTSTSATCTQTLTITAPSEVSKNYTITATANNTATPPTYFVIATPIGGQLTRDTACGTIKVDQSGTKYISGTGTVNGCWQ